MFNRYFAEKRDGVKKSDADQEITTKLETRKEDRRKRANAEYAARATRRVEDWMVSAADEPKPEEEIDPNPFRFEFRSRKKSSEITQGGSCGAHTISANRYETEAVRVAKAEALAATATRGEYQEQRFGESPFRKREKVKERHPPLRMKAVTEAERINEATNTLSGGLGPGADPLKEPQMGFDDIPVGMRPDAVVVRAKAKAPGPLQFKRFGNSRPRMLNPPDPYVNENYINAAEPTGYGFTKFNNFRPRYRQKEIDQKKEFLSAVTGCLPLGSTASKRKDRVEPRHIERTTRKFYCAAKTMVVLPAEDTADEVVQSNAQGEPETRTDLATRLLKNQGANKPRHLEVSDT